MSRKFISMVLAASIAVTSLNATSAEAGNRDLNRFLVGATLLLMLGAASSSKRREAIVPAPSAQPRPVPHIVRRKMLPRKCVREVAKRNGGIRKVMFKGCLRRNYDYVHTLPNKCTTNVRKTDGTRHMRPAYSVHCLRDRGYRFSRG